MSDEESQHSAAVGVVSRICGVGREVAEHALTAALSVLDGHKMEANATTSLAEFLAKKGQTP